MKKVIDAFISALFSTMFCLSVIIGLHFVVFNRTPEAFEAFFGVAPSEFVWWKYLIIGIILMVIFWWLSFQDKEVKK